jgi:hypothetical protein
MYGLLLRLVSLINKDKGVTVTQTDVFVIPLTCFGPSSPSSRGTRDAITYLVFSEGTVNLGFDEY